MSDHTPYGSWDSRLGAKVWLQQFINESLEGRHLGLSDDGDLFDAVFEVHRVRWQVCFRLRGRFVDDPDALLDLVEEYAAKKAQEQGQEKAAEEGLKEVGEWG